VILLRPDPRGGSGKILAGRCAPACRPCGRRARV